MIMGNKFRQFVYKSSLLGRFLGYFLTFFQYTILSFYKDEKIVNLIKTTKNEVDFAFYPHEAFILYSIAKSQSNIFGDMAEVGSYQGGSSKIICEAKKEQNFHIFDTFEGLPHVTEKDTHFGTKFWHDNDFDQTSEDNVKKYLSKYPNVFLHKGLFPFSAESIKHLRFSFVHLDVDLYTSTLESLNFFYPRLVLGGIILTHDFHSSGVHAAFDEFFKGKQIPIIELTGTQCMIVKLN